MIDYSDTEKVIEECFEYLDASSREKFDVDKAEKVASLMLVAQMKVSFLIEDVEMKARQSKNEISRIEGEKYFEYKNDGVDGKKTENMIANYLAKEPEVIKAKEDNAKYDSLLKKWMYIYNVLKDSHIFYRSTSKSKTWSE